MASWRACQVSALEMHRILKKLQGGDLRSKGRSEEVFEDVLKNPDLFAILFNGMLHDDPVIRMRAADAMEKIARQRANLLQPFKKRLIDEVAKIEQQEVRWHVAQMFSCLELTKVERGKVAAILHEYLQDKSSIVKTFAMQALADLARQDETVKRKVVPLLRKLTETGSPAMQSRGRKLLAELAD